MLKFRRSKSVLRTYRANITRLDGLAMVRQFSSTTKQKQLKGLVVGLYSSAGDRGAELSTAAKVVDGRTAGKLCGVIKEAGLTGQLGKGKVFKNLDEEFGLIAVIGIGTKGIGWNKLGVFDGGVENVRVAAGVGVRSLQLQGCTEVHIDGMEYPEQAAEGSGLAVWHYSDNKQGQDRVKIPNLKLYDSLDVDAWTRGLFKAEARNTARRLSEAAANQMTPTAFAQAVVDCLRPCGVSVEIRTLDCLEMQSPTCEPAVMLDINYCPAVPEENRILFLGKGMTLNCGTLCLQACKGAQRGAMAGAAELVGVICAAATHSLPLNISAIIPLCEDMAFNPGDIAPVPTGKTPGVCDVRKAGVITADQSLEVDVATHKAGLSSSKAGSNTPRRRWWITIRKFFKRFM